MTMSAYMGLNKLQDNSPSNSYNTSPYSTPPPPPPPSHSMTNPISMTQKLTSLLLNEQNRNKESRQPLPNNKLPPKTNTSNSTTSKQDEVKKDLRNFKLLIDPVIKKGHTKITRYDGVLTGVCVELNFSVFI